MRDRTFLLVMAALVVGAALPEFVIHRVFIAMLVFVPIYWFWSLMDKTERKDSE